MAATVTPESLEAEIRKIEEEAERKKAELREKALAPLKQEKEKLLAEQAETNQRINARIAEIDSLLGVKKRGRRSTTRRATPNKDALLADVKRVVGDSAADGINATQVAEKLDVSPNVARNTLNELIESGAVIRAGERRGTKFFGKAWEADAKKHAQAQGS